MLTVVHLTLIGYLQKKSMRHQTVAGNNKAKIASGAIILCSSRVFDHHLPECDNTKDISLDLLFELWACILKVFAWYNMATGSITFIF